MAQWTRQDGGQIFYQLREGPRQDAPLIVLLNGMTQTTQNWSTQSRMLSEHARVLTYDARGQGRSDVGDEALTLALHARDLIGLLDSLGVAQAALVGFSHGARVALATAAGHPERVSHLVCCSATATPDALATTIMTAWREVLRLGGLEAMSWAALPTILGEGFLRESQSVLPGIIRAGVQRNTEEGIARLLDALLEHPSLAELAQQVRCPALVISSDRDLLVSPEGAQELARCCGGTHALVEGSGHTIPIEQPERFRQLVLEHLGVW